MIFILINIIFQVHKTVLLFPILKGCPAPADPADCNTSRDGLVHFIWD